MVPAPLLLRLLLHGLSMTLIVSQGFQQHMNYPVKSINLSQAPEYIFWTLDPTELEDAHPVEGIETSDRGYVVVGRALESDGGPDEGFAVKFSAAGVRQWAWQSNHAGMDYAVSPAELPNGEIIIAGYRASGQIPRASLTKLSANGAEVWTALFYVNAKCSDDTRQSFACGSLAASVDVAADGVVLGGGKELTFGSPLGADTISFHSAGNPSPSTSQIWVAKLPLSAVYKTSAPTEADFTWTYTIGGGEGSYVYARTVHFLPVSNDVVATLTSCETCNPEVPMIRLSGATGTVVWGPLGMNSVIGTLLPNDFDVTADGNTLILAGNHPWPGKIGIGGFIAKVNSSTGAVLWSDYYGVGVLPRDQGVDQKVHYNECWGVKATSDGGAVMSCGTGIEGCGSPHNTLPTALTTLSQCQAGSSDHRAGAIPKTPGVWSSMTIRVDRDGGLLWQRVDAMKPEECVGNTCGSSSAGEWSIVGADGSIAIVVDEGDGVGLAKFGTDPSAGTTAGMPASPGTAPSPVPAPSPHTVPSPVPEPSSPSPGIAIDGSPRNGIIFACHVAIAIVMTSQ